MRKFTLFLALMVAMVTTAFAQTVVSNLSDFKSDKCYTVTTPSRGGWAVNSDASQFCSTNDAGLGTESDATDVNQQFAVLSVNGEDYFLYSVGAKKFIKHDRTLSAVSGDAIEFADASKEGAGRVRVNFKGIENSYINLGGSNQMSVDWWGTIDAGNAVQFLEVADFDATEALNLLNSKVELVYVYQYEGKEISRQTVDVMVGEAYPAINAPYGFTADAPQGVVEAAGEKIVECTFAGYPFEYAESVDAITTWYYIQMHSNNKKFIQYVDGANNIEWADAEVAEGEENSYIWAFVGTPATGFKLVNYAATVEKALCSDGSSDPAMGAFANGVNWVPAASDVVGDAFFCLQYPGSSNYMNAQNGKVAYWNDNDAGSTLQLTVAEPVVATPEPVTFDIYALDDSMNPSPLEGTVSKLGYVVFAASDNNAVLAEAADAPKVCIFDPAMGGAVAEASSIMFGDLLGNGMQLVAVQFDGFATPGAYMVYAPAGAFTVNGQPNEEIVSAQFTIPAPVVKVFEVESVTPANNAEVEAINKIEIKFTEDIYLSMDDRGNFYPVNLVDENNNVIELTTSDDANIYSKAVFTPAEPITAAGTYTLDLSQIKLDGGVCEGSYSWTVVAPAAEPGIDTSKEYYLYSSYNWGMNSGYLTIGTKSGSNYGQVYMDSNKKQSFKLTPSGDGYVVSRLADMGGMSYPEYLDCSHAYNVGNNAMSGSVLYFELNTNGKYYIRSANGYFKADKIDYTTTDWAYHVFSNGDMTSAMEWELVPAIDEEPTTPAVAPVIQTISPAAGAVVEGGVSEIVITFDKEIKSVSSGAQIKVKLGAATTRAYGSNATIDGCTVTFKFGDGGQFGFTTIEDAGEYSVEIPASLCTSEDGGASEAFSYKFTIAAPVVEPGIDTSKEYYLYSSYNWGMNSGYLTIGTKSGSNYGQVYMDSNKKQSFKLTPSGDGYVVSRLADMGGMSYPEYLDCSHAYNVGNNAMSGSVLYFELNTNGKYYIRSANGYFKADKIDYTTTDWAYHVFSNGDMTSAMEWELVPAIDEEPTTPAVAPVIQTISPAAGAVVEGGVSEIVITFDKEIKSVSSGAQIKVKLGAATTRAYGSNATIDGCTVTFKFGDGGQFGFTTIEDAGEYSVEIPASLCTSEDGGASEAFSYKFTIAAPAELPALESTKYDRNPLETSYDFTTGLMGKFLLSGVKIYFGEVVKKYTTDLSGDYGQILDADGNVVATLDKCMGANGTMNDFATPYTTTPITAAGTYKVVVKSGVILSADGTKEYKGGEFTFTVEKAAVEVIPSAEDGFFWNASYSHVDEFNKQVITVKNADNDVVINNEVKATLTCGENVYEATVTVEKFDNIQEITLAFDGEFVEGKYTLDVPAGLFTVDGVANEAYAQSTFTYRKPQLEITRDFDSWESYLDQVWYMPKGAIITIANAQSVEVDDTKVATIAVGESVYNSTLSYYYDEWSNAYYIELMFEDFYAEGFEFVKGDYTFTLPAGLYTVNGVANEEAVKAYTYGDPIVEEFSVTEILPAAGSVLESLDAIAITFSNGAQPDILPVTCGDATYYFVSMYGMYVAVDLMSYEPIVITEPGTYTLDLSELEGLVGEKVFSWTIAEAVEEPVDYTPTYTGTVERNDRNVTAVTLGDNRYDLLTPEQSSCYVDATETVTFTVVAGATVKASVEHKGEWVHHSVYIDLDGDGFTSGLEEGSEWKPAGDLVTYSFYNNNGSSDEYGYNSVGTYMSGMDRHVPEMPEFTAPTTPGIYRIRFVQDWCSIDPNGDSDGKFGDFMANGGQIVDVMLEVVEGTTDGIEEVDAEAEKVIYDLTGRRILEITKSGIYVVNGKKVIVK